MSIEEKYDEVRQLIAIGKEKGYLLYDEVNELLPSDYPYVNEPLPKKRQATIINDLAERYSMTEVAQVLPQRVGEGGGAGEEGEHGRVGRDVVHQGQRGQQHPGPVREVQHAIRLVPLQLALDVHRELRLDENGVDLIRDEAIAALALPIATR